MVLIDLHPSNESLRIFKPAGKVISLSDVQSSKAIQPISVTLAGIMILSKDLQVWYLQPVITQHFASNKSEIWS